MDVLLLSLILVFSQFPGYSSWSTRYDDHMFPYGSEAGDEKITFIDDQPAIRDISRKPLDKLQIYRDGHIELYKQRTSSRFTPFIAPYHLPYSEVTSGHVWYRETQDPDSLDQIAAEIQSVFHDDGLVGNPNGMIVVTWQFEEVTAKYPECEGEIPAEYEKFCSCMDGNFQPSPTVARRRYLLCECAFHPKLMDRTATQGFVDCNILTVYEPNYRFSLCLGISAAHTTMSFDYSMYCTCEARGGTQSIASCAARHTFNAVYMGAIVGCAYCECMEGRLYSTNTDIYCRCVGGVDRNGPERPDVCTCLADNGYTGTEGDCPGMKRSSQHLDSKQYKRDEISEYLNTFQAAIVYNKWQMFVYFTYRKLEYIDVNVVTKLGYVETTTSAFNVYTHPYSEDPILLQSLLYDSNMNIDGRWIYKMGRNVQQPPWTPRDSCIAGVTCHL